MPGSPMALRAGAFEHGLPLLFELVERRIGIGQRYRAQPDSVGERANAVIRKQHTLKGSQIVEQLLRWDLLNLRVIGERAERLFLKRRHAGVQLVPAGVVRTARPGIDSVGACELRSAPKVARRSHWRA